MTADAKVFGVKRVLLGQSEAEVASTVVQATSPKAAAEVVLGRQLSAVGSPRNLRALVWHMQNDYNPVCTYFYEPDVLDTGLRPHRSEKLTCTPYDEERRLHVYVVAIAFLVSLAIAGLVILR